MEHFPPLDDWCHPLYKGYMYLDERTTLTSVDVFRQLPVIGLICTSPLVRTP
jgi:hypothetical protein